MSICLTSYFYVFTQDVGCLDSDDEYHDRCRGEKPIGFYAEEEDDVEEVSGTEVLNRAWSCAEVLHMAGVEEWLQTIQGLTLP